MARCIEVFTDGSCLGNPGPGGWAALLRLDGEEQEISGGEKQTTNNRMELMATIEGLRAAKRLASDAGDVIRVTLDSKYVRDGVEKWSSAWIRNGWRTANKKPVKNQDLWRLLLAEVKDRAIEWSWTEGHAGHRENEMVDKAANKAAQQEANG